MTPIQHSKLAPLKLKQVNIQHSKFKIGRSPPRRMPPPCRVSMTRKTVTEHKVQHSKSQIMKLKLLTLSLILFLGGALQTIPAQGGMPHYEPAHNIAVGTDARAAEIGADQLTAKGGNDRFIGLTLRRVDRLRHGLVTGTLLHQCRVLDKSSSQIVQIWSAACLRQPQLVSGTDIFAASVRRPRTIPYVLPYTVQAIQSGYRMLGFVDGTLRHNADLTSSKLGGVLYCADEGRWLPDGRSQNPVQRAAEIHDDRRPCIPRDCNRPECMFRTGILSSTRNVYSKYSDRGISLRDSYCQADCIVYNTRICPPQQIINCLKIPNSEQSIYSRLFYALAGLDMGLIPRKEVRHV